MRFPSAFSSLLSVQVLPSLIRFFPQLVSDPVVLPASCLLGDRAPPHRSHIRRGHLWYRNRFSLHYSYDCLCFFFFSPVPFQNPELHWRCFNLFSRFLPYRCVIIPLLYACYPSFFFFFFFLVYGSRGRHLLSFGPLNWLYICFNHSIRTNIFIRPLFSHSDRSQPLPTLYFPNICGAARSFSSFRCFYKPQADPHAYDCSLSFYICSLLSRLHLASFSSASFARSRLLLLKSIRVPPTLFSFFSRGALVFPLLHIR